MVQLISHSHLAREGQPTPAGGSGSFPPVAFPGPGALPLSSWFQRGLLCALLAEGKERGGSAVATSLLLRFPPSLRKGYVGSLGCKADWRWVKSCAHGGEGDSDGWRAVFAM